jgi:hypothetical protein
MWALMPINAGISRALVGINAGINNYSANQMNSKYHSMQHILSSTLLKNHKEVQERDRGEIEGHKLKGRIVDCIFFGF